MIGTKQAYDAFADALSVLSEDRTPEELKQFDELFEQAKQENYAWEREQERKQKIEQRKFFWAGLMFAMRGAKDVKVAGAEDDILISCNGKTFKAQTALGFWEFPRKVEVNHGGYGRGSRTTFRLKKNGTYNYSEIADAVVQRAKAAIAAAINEDRRNSNLNFADDLRRKLRLKKYSSVTAVTASSVIDKPVCVQVKFAKNLTVDQAEKLITFLRDSGVMPEYDFVKEGEAYVE